MPKVSLIVTLALLGAMTCLTGCAGRATASSSAASNFSRPAIGGVKSPSQVSPCCRPLAEGKVSLDQCMTNPQCVANGNRCCMNAF